MVDEKVALLALLEAVFSRPTADRVLRFEEVRAVCGIAPEEVSVHVTDDR